MWTDSLTQSLFINDSFVQYVVNRNVTGIGVWLEMAPVQTTEKVKVTKT